MLIIFDWDGTLLNSTAKIVGCMQQAAEDCSLPVLEDMVIQNIIGLGLPEAIHTLYPETELEQRQAVQQAYSQAFVKADHVPCDFYSGVQECLVQLQDEGHSIAVATGKSRKGLNRVLTNLDWHNRFAATRCADETASKPHPKMLLELMDELNFAKEETWMIGDTEYDLAMASNAQVKSVGVSYGAHHPDRLKKHNPKAIIDNMLELPILISK